MGKDLIAGHFIPSLSLIADTGDRWESVIHLPNYKNHWVEVVGRTLEGCPGCIEEGGPKCTFFSRNSDDLLKEGDRIPSGMHRRFVEVKSRKDYPEDAEARYAIICTLRSMMGNPDAQSVILGAVVKTS